VCKESESVSKRGRSGVIWLERLHRTQVFERERGIAEGRGERERKRWRGGK